MNIHRNIGPDLVPLHLFLAMLLAFSSGCGQSDVEDRPPVSIRLTSVRENRDATWSPDGKRIAFASNREGTAYDIYVIEVPEDTLATPEDVERTAVNLTRSGSFDRYPIWSPDGQWIAYLSTGGEGTEIWVVSSDGKETRTITRDGMPKDGMVCWSPDGTQIAFGMVEGDHNVWVVDLSTGEERRLTSDPAKDWLPAWSPDGLSIAFASDRAGSGDIYVFDRASGALRRVVDWPSDEMSPYWSPDGRWIAFTSWAEGNWDVWVVPASGGQAVRITRTPESEFVPRWSPDGRWIACNRVSERELHLVSIPDGALRRIAFPRDILGLWGLAWSPDGAYMAFAGMRSADRRDVLGTIHLSDGTVAQLATMSAYYLSWSPDGSEIAFTSSKSGNADIWTVPSSEGRPRQITIDRADDWRPSWSPDGSEIAFVSDRGGSLDIWAIPSTGGNPRRIASGEEDAYGPSWSPDGRWIAFATGEEIRKVSAEGGIAIQVASVQDGFPSSISWLEDGRTLRYFTRDRDGRISLYEVPASGGNPSRVMRFSEELGWPEGYALSPDGRTFAAVPRNRVDIWMLEVPSRFR